MSGDCEYEWGHTPPTKGRVDVHLVAENVDLCSECAVAYLTWCLDGGPDPDEFPEFVEWSITAAVGAEVASLLFFMASWAEGGQG